MLAPLVGFLHNEAASGGLLLVCTGALAPANSPAAEWFANVWKTPVSISPRGRTLTGDVGQLIVNEVGSVVSAMSGGVVLSSALRR